MGHGPFEKKRPHPLPSSQTAIKSPAFKILVDLYIYFGSSHNIDLVPFAALTFSGSWCLRYGSHSVPYAKIEDHCTSPIPSPFAIESKLRSECRRAGPLRVSSYTIPSCVPGCMLALDPCAFGHLLLPLKNLMPSRDANHFAM